VTKQLVGGLGRTNLPSKSVRLRRKAAAAQEAKHRELAEREPTNGPLTGRLQKREEGK
jgi:hypothetical protein